MKAPETFETSRLVLRRPTHADAEVIFLRYSSDPAVTRYLSWPTHRSVADTHAFIFWDETEWLKWPAGNYLIFPRGSDHLVGGTGLSFKSSTIAVTGYVLAQDAWGQGFATEALSAMVDVARQTGVKRVEAICHAEHAPSARVLEKCEFLREAVSAEQFEFPNLTPKTLCDVLSYARDI
jgi:[ribosomal protein S5]-alanine N-acetyltransferase